MKKKGFSLVELMIVVAIIGVLAAIAIPSFIQYINKSKQSEYTSIINGISNGEFMYSVANQSFKNAGSGATGIAYAPVAVGLLTDKVQQGTIQAWSNAGSDIGYLPDALFYGTAKGNGVNATATRTQLFVYVAQDIDDDGTTRLFAQELAKATPGADAYKNGSINSTGDDW